jgi:hypothetical protein
LHPRALFSDYIIGFGQKPSFMPCWYRLEMTPTTPKVSASRLCYLWRPRSVFRQAFWGIPSTVWTDGAGAPTEFSTNFLNHPVVCAWLTAASAFPDAMAIEVMGRPAIVESLRLPRVVQDPTKSPGSVSGDDHVAVL